ncbi:DUF1284 domain-containing protein [Microaerobacter geothermalis]|uniref:DUF1284 domain-containing protein n=1 Tax=Microaerobacter geothermalis TaxID=674972 RepID=UPI001F46C157|nr:DUF1284 domain-containing protein [Microaerobacter geothermalis]MCF6092531.1 DUF1284 domain-containing protein [Microaerobacter geothermalis]
MGRTLRGHHLLCIHGFQGAGYSPEFIEKMREVVADIRNHDVDFPIKVIVGLDETCQVCPNADLVQNLCIANEGSQDHVVSMDTRAIQFLDLEPNQTYMKNDLVRRTKERVKPGDLDHLCEGCSWLEYGYCKDGLERLRNT